MGRDDLIAGLALATFLSIPFGVVCGLVIKVSSPFGKFNPDEPLVTSGDAKRILLAALVFIVVLTVPLARLTGADRKGAESWQVYILDHKCVVVNTRVVTESHVNPATKTLQMLSHTEYLWRCEGGDEYWRR